MAPRLMVDGSEHDLFAGLGNRGVPVQLLFQHLLQDLHFFQFAMHKV